MTMADDGERVAPNVQYTPDAVRAFIDENEDDPNEAERAKGELADAMGTDFDMSGFVDPDAWDMDGKPREAAPEPEPVKDEAPKEEPADAKTETTETPEKEQPEAKAEPDADHSPPPDTGQNDEIAAKLAAQERELADLKAIASAQTQTIRAYESRIAAPKADEPDGSAKATNDQRAAAREEARESLKQLETDYGADFVKPYQVLMDEADSVDQLRGAVQHLAGIVANVAERGAAGDETDDDIDGAIANIPALARWEADARAADAGVNGKSTTQWNAAVAMNDALLENPEWSDKTATERLEHVTKMLGGEVSPTETKTPDKADPGAEAAEAAAAEAAQQAAPKAKTVDEALEEAENKAPSSTSSLAGGADAKDLNTKPIEEMSHEEIADMYAKYGSLDEFYEEVESRIAA